MSTLVGLNCTFIGNKSCKVNQKFYYINLTPVICRLLFWFFHSEKTQLVHLRRVRRSGKRNLITFSVLTHHLLLDDVKLYNQRLRRWYGENSCLVCWIICMAYCKLPRTLTGASRVKHYVELERDLDLSRRWMSNLTWTVCFILQRKKLSTPKPRWSHKVKFFFCKPV